MSEISDLSLNNPRDRIELVTEKIYAVILSNYRLNCSALQNQYRAYRWENEEFKAHIENWIVNVLNSSNEPELFIGNVIKVLNYFMTSSFFISPDFLSVMTEIRQITYPEIQSKIQTNLLPHPEAHDSIDKGISILLLDAENLPLTGDIENFLAGVCTYPIQIKIAFANWRNMGKKDSEFHNRGYELIHVPAGKDSADVKMATVGSSIFIHYPNAKEVLVCSSDGVLTHLCNTLQTHGLNVYLVRKQGENIVVLNTKNSQTTTYVAAGISETISPLDFLNQLKEIISLEQIKSKQRWIKLSSLPNTYLQKYHLNINQVIDLVFPSKKFKDVLVDHPTEFVLHQMPDDPQVYVTIFNQQELPTQLEKENSVSSLEVEINSPENLRKILLKIVEQLTNKTPGKYIKVSDVGANFYTIYGQPITKVTKKMGLGSKLSKVLQSYKNLELRKVGIEYQVAIAK
jgi:hypothetical protein